MKKLLLFAIGIFSFSIALHAQTQDRKWNVGLYGGLTQYEGDLGNDFYKTNEGVYPFGGLSISRYIVGHFDLFLMGTKGVVGSKHLMPSGSRFKLDVSTLTLNARFHILRPTSSVRPYLFVGWGVMSFNKNISFKKEDVDYAAPSYGAGVNFHLAPWLMLNAQEMFMYSTGDNRDGRSGGGNDAYVFHTIGLTFNFGRKKDADGDGVADHADKCPGTPKGVMVDKVGCPVDRDVDGTPDYLDECPDVAGPVNLHGCPDTDNDGVADKNDRCPLRKGLPSLQGCPDTDGDGVADVDDMCPTDPGPVALHGCPDSDNDGVADINDICPNTKAGYKVDSTGCPYDLDKDGVVNEEDRCPDQAGPRSLQGCPDSDGDGVADIDDHCPAIKGTIANKGCPEMAKADVRKITQIASKIFFQTNSAKLKTASLAQLDELANILKRYESANLTIEGYTDNVGADDYNLTLSQKRTESVKTYLMGRGIMESRLTAKGFGKENPIADNKTAAGRAKNRRVELKTSY